MSDTIVAVICITVVTVAFAIALGWNLTEIL